MTDHTDDMVEAACERMWETQSAGMPWGQASPALASKYRIMAKAALRTDRDGVEALLEKHIQACRDRIANCDGWSAAQAEHSRARDTLLNFQAELRALKGDNHAE